MKQSSRASLGAEAGLPSFPHPPEGGPTEDTTPLQNGDSAVPFKTAAFNLINGDSGSDNGNTGGSGNQTGGGDNGNYPPGYDPDADDDPGV